MNSSPCPDDLRLKRPLELAAGAVGDGARQHLRRSPRRTTTRDEGLLPRRRQLRPLRAGGRRRRRRPRRVLHLVHAVPGRSQPGQPAGRCSSTRSLIARLTGMDVANASLYDGGSAAAEGGADGRQQHEPQRQSRRRRRACIRSIGRRSPPTSRTSTPKLVTADCPAGVVDADDLAAAIDDKTACVLVQQPNFFGCVEDVDARRRDRQEAGALLVAVFDPISLGMLKRPGDYGRRHRRRRRAHARHADELRRPVPGHHGVPRTARPPHAGPHRRRNGRPPRQALLRPHAANPRATHPPRQGDEQRLHEPRPVRRASHVYLVAARSARPPRNGQPLPAKVALPAEQLCQKRTVQLAFDAPTFKEFVIRDAENNVDGLLRDALDAGYLAGVPLGRWYPELSDCFLVAVTEKRTKAEIDGLVKSLTANRPPRSRTLAKDNQDAKIRIK